MVNRVVIGGLLYFLVIQPFVIVAMYQLFRRRERGGRDAGTNVPETVEQTCPSRTVPGGKPRDRN